MADTSFTDQSTVILANWSQDINNTVYRLLGDSSGAGGTGGAPLTRAALLANIGALSITDAAATYETIANAAATYETQANAAATYETIANAAATYLTIANAAANYAAINGNATKTFAMAAPAAGSDGVNLAKLQAYPPLSSNNSGAGLTGANTVTATLTAPGPGVIMAIGHLNLGTSGAITCNFVVNGVVEYSTSNNLSQSFSATKAVAAAGSVSVAMNVTSAAGGYNLYVSMLFIPNPGQ